MARNPAVDRPTKVAGRIGRDLRGLQGEQRLVVAAAVGLFVSMFLPWYVRPAALVVNNKPTTVSHSISGITAFTFVEAAVLLVAVGVLFLLFTRSEGRAFHLPGGDGSVIFVAGCWACVLILYRMVFDRPPGVDGVDWGIFAGLIAAVALAMAGWRVRAAHRPEPPLPVAEPPPPPRPPPPSPPSLPPTAQTQRLPQSPPGQLTLDDAHRGGTPPSG
ncbi:MAG TPA: hypothetical protein VHE14_02850 [Solirubrobacteraceae bacterium]|nr:hypothetical protein [Solirubrobacteraceae bacterium]